MTTYQPKPGDRVVSPLLVGEWVVADGVHQVPPPFYTWVCNVETGNLLPEVTARLTPVAPPLPPEPAVGSVVRAHGRYWQRGEAGDWNADYRWIDLCAAPDLSPVVAVDDIAEWLTGRYRDSDAACFRAEFGGWGQ